MDLSRVTVASKVQPSTSRRRHLTHLAMDSVGPLILRAANSALESYHSAPEYQYNHQFQGRFHEARETVVGLIPWLQRILTALFFAGCVVSVSLATYGLFYMAVMPAPHAAEPLFFDYSCSQRPTVADSCAKEDETCSPSIPPCHPSATVDILAKHSSWEAHFPELLPEFQPGTHTLIPRKRYFLEVVLELPETDVNRQIGMFGVQVVLQTGNRTKLATSVRSTRLPYESFWISLIRKQICIIPLMVGALSEARTVILPAFRHYIESKTLPLVGPAKGRYDCVLWPSHTCYSNRSPFPCYRAGAQVGRTIRQSRRPLAKLG